MTAPPAWRAISPVSRVTVWLPYWKLLVIFATWNVPWMSCFRLTGRSPCPVRVAVEPGGRGVSFQRGLFQARLFQVCKSRPRRIAAPRSGYCLATQAQFLDQGLVALVVLALQVVEQAATTVDHHQQAATAVVVLLVGLEVAGEMLDPGCEQGDLDFGGTGVVVAALVFGDDLAGVDGHV